MPQNSILYFLICWLLAMIMHFGYKVAIKRQNYFFLSDAVCNILSSSFLAVALAGFFVILQTGFGLIRIIVYGTFAPRAVDLIIWGLTIYFFFAPRLKFRSIPFVMMMYGLDEIVWNALFFLRNPGLASLSWLSDPVWTYFFIAVSTAFIIGALLSRPTLTIRSIYVVLPFCFFAVYFVAGMPVAISVIPGQGWNGWNYFWELGWQLSYLSVWRLVT